MTSTNPAGAAANAVGSPAAQPQPQPTSQDDTSTHTQTVESSTAAQISSETTAPPMSKNALKRLRKAQEWEDGKEDRRKRRKEKRVVTKAKKRDERAALIAQGADPAVVFAKKKPAALVPVSLIIDCDFESYMTDKEQVSLSSQVTRSYSENRNFKYKSHLWVAGWGGKMEERFTTALRNTYLNWKGVGFEPGDFLATAARARERMQKQGGQMVDSLKHSLENGAPAWTRDPVDPFPLEEPIPPLNDDYKDVVYLTSDSPYTLQRLEPNTSYVIGGIVDKNREKGLCYRRAVERGIRTAKLPIGQFMVMQSRQVLATNHVVEIMLKWLECEDWGEAFLHVIPKRKGGRLRDAANKDDGEGEDGDEDEEDLEEDEDEEEELDEVDGGAEELSEDVKNNKEEE